MCATIFILLTLGQNQLEKLHGFAYSAFYRVESIKQINLTY